MKYEQQQTLKNLKLKKIYKKYKMVILDKIRLKQIRDFKKNNVFLDRKNYDIWSSWVQFYLP